MIESPAARTVCMVAVAVALVKLRPLFGVTAVAARVKSAGPAVPPSLLVTLLTSLRVAGLSVLVMVQVTAVPRSTVTAFLARLRVPPVVQLHWHVALQVVPGRYEARRAG